MRPDNFNSQVLTTLPLYIFQPYRLPLAIHMLLLRFILHGFSCFSLVFSPAVVGCTGLCFSCVISCFISQSYSLRPCVSFFPFLMSVMFCFAIFAMGLCFMCYGMVRLAVVFAPPRGRSRSGSIAVTRCSLTYPHVSKLRTEFVMVSIQPSAPIAYCNLHNVANSMLSAIPLLALSGLVHNLPQVVRNV